MKKYEVLLSILKEITDNYNEDDLISIDIYPRLGWCDVQLNPDSKLKNELEKDGVFIQTDSDYSETEIKKYVYFKDILFFWFISK